MEWTKRIIVFVLFLSFAMYLIYSTVIFLKRRSEDRTFLRLNDWDFGRLQEYRKSLGEEEFRSITTVRNSYYFGPLNILNRVVIIIIAFVFAFLAISELFHG